MKDDAEFQCCFKNLERRIKLTAKARKFCAVPISDLGCECLNVDLSTHRNITHQTGLAQTEMHLCRGKRCLTEEFPDQSLLSMREL